MTPDQIIAEIWKLDMWQAMEVALRDDGIVFLKMWPIWLSLGIILIIGIYWRSNRWKRFLIR